jgi:hypothetical protein
LKKWKKKNLIFLSHFDRFPFDVGELYSSPPVFVRSGENLIKLWEMPTGATAATIKKQNKNKNIFFRPFLDVNQRKKT